MPDTLLLADDSVTIQRVVELTFADENIRVVAVSDGDEAIARIDAEPPDIVLADVGMPGRNGYEVAQYVKSSPRLAHIPVLLLTGAFEPVDQARAKQAGCEGVLAKPFEPPLVIARVKELLAAARQPATTIMMPSPIAPTAPLDLAHLDLYFDELDRVLTNLSDPVPSSSEAPTTVPGLADAATVILRQGANAPEPAVSDAAPVQEDATVESDGLVDAHAAVDAHEDVQPAVVSAAPVAPAAADIVPAPEEPAIRGAFPLADAFAALLDAEERGSAPSASWPEVPVPNVRVTEEIVEAIVQKVLGRLSDRVMRQAVDATVMDVAERLVREEIERIKSSIK